MARRSVAIVIHEGVQALDVAGPLDVFAEANGFLEPDTGYDIQVIGADCVPMRSSNGTRLMPDLDFQGAASVFSVALVAGGPKLPDMPADPALNRWLCEWATKADRFGSICTGAFALGRAGLLDGRKATTHWQNAARLAAMFPDAKIEHDRIYLRDDRLVTSAGVTAGIDLALALVAEDHGSAVALMCAKRLVVAAQRQGGQSQFSPFLLGPLEPESPLEKIQAYILQHPREALPVDRLAEIAGVSSRSIARMFINELGVTPHEFVESIKIDRARNILEATDLPLKAVAYEAGFQSAERMRVTFQRKLNVSPTNYRSAFNRA